ncbi:hypothetical protein [Streptomyces sp. NPDC101234]|uniref:hypothetical protein n=1 Tax=Streptomyces sp. NPDC101234 TaxID=3366138 RepID=UPI00382B900F
MPEAVTLLSDLMVVLGTPSLSGDTARRSGLPPPCNAAQPLFTPVLARLQRSRLSALLGIDIVATPTASGSWRSRHRIAETLRSEALWRQLAYHVPAGPFVALGALTVLGSWALGALFTSLPLYAWALPAGPGAKGERVYDWAAARLPVVWEFDGDQHTHQRWMPARRSITRPEEIAFYLAFAPLDAALADLVRIAGSRWKNEESFQSAKNECGPDQYEVRRFVGRYRHITLTMLAHAFLVVMAAQERKKGQAPGTRPTSWTSPRPRFAVCRQLDPATVLRPATTP